MSSLLIKNIKKFLLLICVFYLISPGLVMAAVKHKAVHKKPAHTHQVVKHTKHKKIVQRKKRKTPAPATKTPNTHPVPLAAMAEQEPVIAQDSFVSSMEHRLINFVHKTISTLRYSAYKLGGTHFNVERGIYILDCSTYVDRVLQAIYPNAYSSLVSSTGSDKPTSQHYYDFFSALSDRHQSYWNKVNEIEELRPGDILVFRYKNSLGNETGGHVMIVMDKPILDEDAFLVRVADSAPAGHSKDTRAHTSGIGVGTLVLKENPQTGQPYAYAWKIGSRFKKNVNFAMARPVET